MRGAGLFPEPSFLGPVRFRAGAHRHPDLDSDLRGITACLFGQTAQLAEHVERALVRRIGVGHPAVTPFGDAWQGALVMAAVPDRDPARGGPRVDAGILDRVPPSLEVEMRLGP